ncbi:hypothetical protein DGWBC_0280 [Dehalogenimonas sp. WBC-2]|nr:hypothetical protein DGWBC_0280 [Dehalogenimonas sp. WBC-2]
MVFTTALRSFPVVNSIIASLKLMDIMERVPSQKNYTLKTIRIEYAIMRRNNNNMLT